MFPGLNKSIFWSQVRKEIRVLLDTFYDIYNNIISRSRFFFIPPFEECPLHEDQIFQIHPCLYKSIFWSQMRKEIKVLLDTFYDIYNNIISRSRFFFHPPIWRKSPPWRPIFSNFSLSIQKNVLVGVYTKFTTDEEGNKSFV